MGLIIMIFFYTERARKKSWAFLSTFKKMQAQDDLSGDTLVLLKNLYNTETYLQLCTVIYSDYMNTLFIDQIHREVKIYN